MKSGQTLGDALSFTVGGAATVLIPIGSGTMDVGSGGLAAVLTPAEATATAVAANGALRGGANLLNDAFQKSSNKETSESGDSKKGGGRNEQKSNPERQSEAKDKLKTAKAERDELKSKPNKTPEDKAKLEKLDTQVKHLQKKATEKSETHSRKQKGPQQ